MLTVNRWRKYILEYLGARTTKRFGLYKCSGKEEIMSFIGKPIDENFHVAWSTLLADGLLICTESNGRNFYQMNKFDDEKEQQIRNVLREESVVTSDLVRPDESETKKMNFQFAPANDKRRSDSSFYYYYTKKNDPTYWVGLRKKKLLQKADREYLGSYKDPKSRLRKLLHAAIISSKTSDDGTFIQQDIEKLEPLAAGNNRIRSKMALEDFLKERMG